MTDLMTDSKDQPEKLLRCPIQKASHNLNNYKTFRVQSLQDRKDFLHRWTCAQNAVNQNTCQVTIKLQ